MTWDLAVGRIKNILYIYFSSLTCDGNTTAIPAETLLSWGISRIIMCSRETLFKTSLFTGCIVDLGVLSLLYTFVVYALEHTLNFVQIKTWNVHWFWLCNRQLTLFVHIRHSDTDIMRFCFNFNLNLNLNIPSQEIICW